MTGGFRVLGARAARGSAEPRIVAYRLDPDSLAVTDLAGDAEDLFGFPREEWRRPGFFHERMHPDDRDEAWDFYCAWRLNRFSHELQYRLIDAAGRVRWVHDILEVRDDGRGGYELHGVLLDVTQQVASDADAGRGRRLREELLRIVAEELSQPVRTIAGYADMLGRHLSAQRDDVGSDFAVGVREGVQRLDTVLARLLRVAQSGDAGPELLAESLATIRSKRDRQ